MAMRVGLNRSGEAAKVGISFNLRRCIHAISQQPSFGSIMSPSAAPSPPMLLPEDDIGFQSNHPSIDGSLELMAVPKRKTTPSRKKIRNAPKFLKPARVIIRCTVCGRVTLPHFFCCIGIKEDNRKQD